MDDLEAARRRRLAEIQAAQRARAPPSAQDPEAAAQAEARAAAREEAAVERLLQQVLDSEARERLQRVRMSRPDLAAEVVHQVVALAQAGRLARRLTDADLKAALAQLSAGERDIKITRK